MNWMKRFLHIEWEAIAGIIAAVAAILMHFLHVVEINVLLTISVVLIAVLYIRDLRRERVIERMEGSLERSEAALGGLQRKLLELETKIERQLDGLLAARECEFIDNLDHIWRVARSMVNAVAPDGFLFDTRSVSNTAEYEHAVEQLAVAGVHVKRIVATSHYSSHLNDYIWLPSGYRNGPVAGNVELRHLPSDLAFDVLIAQHGGDISAMIGFKTARSERRYTSALHVFGRHFAREILSIHTSVLWEQAHDPAIQSNKGCDVCGQIMRQRASSLTPHEPDSGRVNG